MTAEDKALQLLDKFNFNKKPNNYHSKQCALMCVYEIMEALIEQNLDVAYWKEVRMHLHYIGTDEFEAKADKFNLNA